VDDGPNLRPAAVLTLPQAGGKSYLTYGVGHMTEGWIPHPRSYESRGALGGSRNSVQSKVQGNLKSVFTCAAGTG